LSVGLLAAAVEGALADADDPPSLPGYAEVYGVIRSNLTSLSPAEFERLAVKGLLDGLKAFVTLAPEGTPATVAQAGPKLSQTKVYDDAYAYFRVATVGAGLAEELAEAYEKLSASNKLNGLVLDLRFADGEDYAEAAAVADRFLTKERTLLSWSGETARSTAKGDAWMLPVTVLVNAQTGAAAEALAAVLRHTEVGLVIGSTTAGRASVFKEIPLSKGQRLRIAAEPVKLGDGQNIGGKGLTPDIHVSVSAEDEKAYFADAYKIIARTGVGPATNLLASGSSTNRPPRRRINEAELVRMQREGIGPDADTETVPGRAAEPGKPLVTDPVLARALDLLKGLAVVQKVRPL
jgi:hypothetical protein